VIEGKLSSGLTSPIDYSYVVFSVHRIVVVVFESVVVFQLAGYNMADDVAPTPDAGDTS